MEKMSGAKRETGSAPSQTVRHHVCVGENEFAGKLGFKLGAFKNSGFEFVADFNDVPLYVFRFH